MHKRTIKKGYYDMVYLVYQIKNWGDELLAVFKYASDAEDFAQARHIDYRIRVIEL